MTLSKPRLIELLAGHTPGGIVTAGDPAALRTLMGLLDELDPAFAIVTPSSPAECPLWSAQWSPTRSLPSGPLFLIIGGGTGR